jgi:hypothetical protein
MSHIHKPMEAIRPTKPAAAIATKQRSAKSMMHKQHHSTFVPAGNCGGAARSAVASPQSLPAKKFVGSQHSRDRHFCKFHEWAMNKIRQAVFGLHGRPQVTDTSRTSACCRDVEHGYADLVPDVSVALGPPHRAASFRPRPEGWAPWSSRC